MQALRGSQGADAEAAGDAEDFVHGEGMGDVEVAALDAQSPVRVIDKADVEVLRLAALVEVDVGSAGTGRAVVAAELDRPALVVAELRSRPAGAAADLESAFDPEVAVACLRGALGDA